jgi:hypothetical protein
MFLVLFFRIMPIKSECLKVISQTSVIYVDQYFFYAHNIITTQESHSAINFTIEKLIFSKLLINLVFFGYTTGILF